MLQSLFQHDLRSASGFVWMGGACMSPCSYVPTHSFPCASLAGKEKRDAVPFRCAGPSSPILVAGSTAVVFAPVVFGTTAYVAVKMRLGKKSGKRIELLFWCPGPKARRPRRSPSRTGYRAA